MSDALRPIGRQRLYEQVIEQLRAYATAHDLKAGDRLPAERVLADRLEVSRVSIKQAIVALEVQGLLEVRHGGGTYLRRDSLDVEPFEVLADRKRRLPDVLDAREALETKLAELAARRRTEEDLAEIDRALEYMRAEIDAGELGIEGDRRFHAAVTAAAHSALMAQFMQSMAERIGESRHESLRQPGRPARSFAQHQRIAEAIRAGHAPAAAAAMRRHVHSVSRVRLLDWEPEADPAG
ncbi:FadR/GntR family transcriptional regulator [Paractinoplanes durhamensis]|uniref:FadR/GntR family transcriptional regulator n=1 Tax=Paractinoplanes durhamensis TaxID=113563 RepID=UPI0031DB385F